MWSPRVAVGVTVACAVIWGVSFVVNDIALDHVRPGTFAAWRFALASAASLAVALAARAFDPSILRAPVVWWLALLNAGQFLLQYAGQTLTTPARAALAVNASVILVAAFSWIALRERPRRRTLAAMGVALAGVALLETRGDASVLLVGSPAGDAVVFLSGAFGAAMFVSFPAAMRRHGVLNLMAGMFLASLALVLPVALAVDGAAVLAPPPAAYAPLAFTGVVVAALAYTLWAFALRSLTPTISAVILLLEVLAAAALSVSLGRDALSPAAVAGAALLLAGVTALGATTAPVNTPVPRTEAPTTRPP